MPLPTAFQVALVEALGRDWAELARPLAEVEVEVSYAGSQLLERVNDLSKQVASKTAAIEAQVEASRSELMMASRGDDE